MTSVHEATTAWRMPIAYAPGEAEKAAAARAASTPGKTPDSMPGPADAVSNIEADDGFKLFGNDGPSFGDLIDVINPLQHIPLVGTLYREIAGDTLDHAPKVAGNTLYFGPIGALTSVVDVFVEETTGKDVGGHVMGVLDEDREENGLAGRSAVPGDAGSVGRAAPSASTASVDPITAWAAAEMGYRRAEALKQGVEPPRRAYDSLIAAHAAPPQAEPALTQTAMGTASLPRPEPAALDRPTMDRSRPATELATAGAGRADDARHRAVDAPVNAPDPQDDPVMAWAAAETAYAAGMSTTGKRPDPALMAAAPAEGGGWFSSVMLDALDKYHPNPAAAVRPAEPGRARVN